MKKIIIGIILFCGLIFGGCKDEFLAAKPDKALLIPTTLIDMRLLLDNISIMNNCPGYQEIASDDFYATTTGYTAFGVAERNAYIWAKDIYEGTNGPDWNSAYKQIFYANLVLDGLKLLNDNQNTTAKEIEGTAYFYRGIALFYLAQLFAAPYQSATASIELGLPIRLSANVNEKSVRGNLQQTYNQILDDIKSAEMLLPAQTTVKSRPNKAAVYALLSRVYLSMSAYTDAIRYADLTLNLNGKLIDYNNLSITPISLSFPTSLPNGNDEVIFHTSLPNYGFFTITRTIVDSELYNSYSSNDLRKVLYYADRGVGGFSFRGSYSGPSTPASIFGGLATDEVYLNKAECLARSGDAKAAMDNLNLLLINRMIKGTFVPMQAANADDALVKVLTERRKELVRRGIRWTDLRRLNLDKRFSKTIERDVNGTIYTLLPNSKQYVLPIPDNEIKTSGIEQNER
ncbi:RagB/SusD family nutrient uptake outer membrane protein [Pedobacter sp. Du54]|uniref:RagB/SusD family nutrient uptake outer membrane protein n=1 Tax=Pedobacter anseongensis TaxID=3133439 RepID=UPI0030A45259